MTSSQLPLGPVCVSGNSTKDFRTTIKTPPPKRRRVIDLPEIHTTGDLTITNEKHGAKLQFEVLQILLPLTNEDSQVGETDNQHNCLIGRDAQTETPDEFERMSLLLYGTQRAKRVTELEVSV
ncbi:uncharacterized protein LOC125500042 [Athalia rosae]|uniref:uncharacterized protein LOC125500042 n=1 Tax=Athalia rosae TaxID=37344 RepID=UPI0020342890|nr:uncharacterized protein LOC125500042 [Athalia rosae]